MYQGSRVVVSLTMENEGASTAPFLLIEDALPSSLGKAARLVVTGIPPGSRQAMSYSLMARYRGRYRIGPLSIYITDPDGNDVELMWDRPVEQWPLDADGHLAGQFGDELDLDELLGELE